jgi:hypothetical protein
MFYNASNENIYQIVAIMQKVKEYIASIAKSIAPTSKI